MLQVAFWAKVPAQRVQSEQNALVGEAAIKPSSHCLALALGSTRRSHPYSGLSACVSTTVRLCLLPLALSVIQKTIIQPGRL